MSEHGCPQLEVLCLDSLTRAESDRLERATVFAQGDFPIGAAVKIVEDNFRYAALGNSPKIADVDYLGGRKFPHCVTRKNEDR
jgi:hypothetical protein